MITGDELRIKMEKAINYQFVFGVDEQDKVFRAAENCKLLAIEFAKLHVEVALKMCLNEYNQAIEHHYEFGSSEIMNAYSLKNIK